MRQHPKIPPISPTSLKAEGQDKIPIPTRALKVLVKASAFVNLTIYFSDFLSASNLAYSVLASAY